MGPWRIACTCAAIAALTGTLLAPVDAGQAPGSPARAAAPRTAAELFSTTRVWTVELTVTAPNLDAMEPPMPAGPFGGPPPGGPPGPRPGEGPPPGGPGFQPRASDLLTPLLMAHGDVGRSGTLSETELDALVARWWDAWDARRRGAIDRRELTEGLKAAFASAGGPGPGGRGGPPGGGMIRNLFEFEYVHARLRFQGREFADVGLRYKGNNTFMESAGGPKRPLKIQLDRFARGQKLAGVRTLNLHNNVTDPGFMNEAVAYKAFRDAGVAAPRTAYARVYLTVPGRHARRYLGLYTLVENIDEDFAHSRYGTREGAILKPVTPTLFAHMGSDWKPYKEVYDPKTSMTQAQKERLLETCRCVSSPDIEAFRSGIGRYVDLDQLADYLAAAVWIGDQDSILDMGQNLYLHLHPSTGKFTFIPWDQDHTFGNWFIAGTQQDREQLSIERPWIGHKPFLERVFALPAFKERYLAALRRLNAGPFTPARFAATVDLIGAAIRPAMRVEPGDRLPRFDAAAAGAPSDRWAGAGPMGGTPPIPDDPFVEGMRWHVPIKAFVRARARSVSAQLAGQSAGRVIRSIGPPGQPGGPGPGDFGPWSLLAPAMMGALDPDMSGRVTREAFAAAFAGWAAGGPLTTDRLGEAVDRTFRLPELDMPFGPPGPMP